jgi:hypothetical protein
MGSSPGQQNGGIPPNYEWYHEPAYKTDFNVYGKWQQELDNRMDTVCGSAVSAVSFMTIDGFDDDHVAWWLSQH